MRMVVVLGFLVKFPVYVVHYWLPKAHVEASVGGSMLLAGVLLKLGAYGVFLFSSLASIEVSIYLVFYRLGGGVLASVVCFRIKDVKSLIAYSSVAHISLVVFGLFCGREAGMMGAFIMCIAHGFVSSGLFFLAGVVYRATGSRLFIVRGGGLN